MYVQSHTKPCMPCVPFLQLLMSHSKGDTGSAFAEDPFAQVYVAAFLAWANRRSRVRSTAHYEFYLTTSCMPSALGSGENEGRWGGQTLSFVYHASHVSTCFAQAIGVSHRVTSFALQCACCILR